MPVSLSLQLRGVAISTDTLVFLQSAQTVGAKVFGPNGATRAYSAGSGPFHVVRFEVRSLADVFATLPQCPSTAYLVRGAPLPPGIPTIPYRRHREHVGGEPPSLAPWPRHVLPIDYDAPAGDMRDGRALEQNALEIRNVLPESFRTTSCVAQATSSAGVKPGARVRLWFWCSRPVSDAEAKALLVGVPGIDTAIYTPSQPIYVAPPVFEPGGPADPFAGASRWLLINGTAPEVEILETLPTKESSANPLAGISAAPAPAGAPIADGGRNTALTALAGALRRRGASAPTIQAALERHNAEKCIPPLPADEVGRIAGSVAEYDPETIAAIAAPKTSAAAARAARRELKRQLERVQADPALLEDAALRLKPHVELGAMTSAEVTTHLARAVSEADIVRPISREEIHAAVANAPALPAETSGSRAAWAGVLRTSDEGKILPDAENLALFLERTCDVWYDERARKPVWTTAAPWGATGETGDASVELRRFVARELGWLTCPIDPMDVLLVQAKKRPRDTFRDALDSLVWDRTERLIHAAPALLGCEDTHAARTTFAWWLLSAVARTYSPGCQADYMIVLEGKQETGKTSLLRALAGDERYFGRHSNERGSLHDKDTKMLLSGPVIVELAEMSALSKADIAATKAFLDERVDRFRAPYERVITSAPRRCVFAGTVNGTGYLRDTTGNRRFWPILCGALNVELAREWCGQLWAEAVDCYRKGARWWPTPEESRALGLTELQESRRASLPAEEALAAELERPRRPGTNNLTGETWEAWQLGEDGRPCRVSLDQLSKLSGLHGARDAHTITAAMRALGWETQRRRDSGSRLRYWCAPDEEKRGQWKAEPNFKNN